MRITKVKYESNKKTGIERLVIAYQEKNKNDGWDDMTLESAEAPRPEFTKRLQDLAPQVVEMCELPEDRQPRIKVRGVSFSYGGEKEVMGAVISASMELLHSVSPLNLVTAHKSSEPYSDGGFDERQILAPKCCMALRELQREAMLFVNGERAQQELKLEKKKKE
jgi:hypothetical protein